MTQAELSTMAAVKAMEMELDPPVDLELPSPGDLDLEALDLVTPLDLEDMEPCSRPAAPRAKPATSKGTKLVSIRIPARIIAALKTRAAAQGAGYQTIANRVLRAAVREWEMAATKR